MPLWSVSVLTVFVCMFRRIMTWIDSWDDRINPITVRDLRRLNRQRALDFTVVIVWTIAIIVYAVFLIFLPEDVQKLSRTEQGLLFSVLPGIFLFYIAFISSFIAIGGLTYSRTRDELLGIVPLSPQQQVHGYLATSCVISFFLCGLFCPFIAIGQLVGPAPYLLLLVPLATFFILQIFALVFLSFNARIKRNWELMLIVFGVIYLGQLPIIAPWIGLIFLWVEFFRWQELVWNRGFGFVSLFVMLPPALLVVGYVAYRLSIYGFKTCHKPLWRAMLLNIGVYSLLSLILALLYLGVAALVMS